MLGIADKLSWWLTRNELFSVKFAYALEMNKDRRVHGKSSDSTAKEVFKEVYGNLTYQGLLNNSCEECAVTSSSLG